MPTVYIGDNSTGTPTMDYSGCEDTYIKENAATTNYGTDDYLQVGKWSSSGNWQHGLLSFSGLSNITGPVVVSSVTVYLYLEYVGGTPGTQTFTFRRLLRNWVEGEATWNIYSTGNSWTTAGGTDSTDISSTTSVAGDATNTIGEYKSFSAAQLAQDVEDFINGDQSNYGWHIERTDGSGDSTAFNFRQTDQANTATKPYIEVTYTEGGSSIIPQVTHHYRANSR